MMALYAGLVAASASQVAFILVVWQLAKEDADELGGCDKAMENLWQVPLAMPFLTVVATYGVLKVGLSHKCRRKRPVYAHARAGGRMCQRVECAAVFACVGGWGGECTGRAWCLRTRVRALRGRRPFFCLF